MINTLICQICKRLSKIDQKILHDFYQLLDFSLTLRWVRDCTHITYNYDDEYRKNACHARGFISKIKNYNTATNTSTLHL